jgi:hypothetical protein
MPLFFVVVPGFYLGHTGFLCGCAGYFNLIMPDIYAPECRIFSHCHAGFLTQFVDLYLSILVFFVVVPGIYHRCARYFNPIMPDIYTPECQIFLHRHAGLLTQFDGYSFYTSVCQFLFVVVPVFTSGIPGVVVPGFLINLTGVCTSACRIFTLCRVFT